MSIENAREYLKAWNRDKDIMEFEVSSATVDLAAQALNTEAARIAKTLSFRQADGALLVVCAGDTKVDNKKFKEEFGIKAAMLAFEEVGQLVGHEVGGVCPFGVKSGVPIYLDRSLQRFETVFPACGSANSAIELSCAELETISRPVKWVDVCRLKEDPVQ